MRPTQGGSARRVPPVFIFGLLVLAVAVVALVITIFASEKAIPGAVAVIGALIGTGLVVFSCFFTQGVGQSAVLVSWTGEIAGTNSSQGLQSKAPWQHAVQFDVRNQRAVYAGDGGSDNSGGTADGPQITVQDADGVSSNLDIAVTYSIQPQAVQGIYTNYRDEEGLKSRVIANDIRSVVRSVPGAYHTLELLTKRNDVNAAMQKALEQKWAAKGLTVNEVTLQEIRVPDSVKAAYESAQKSQIKVQQAQNDLAATKVSAQQQVVQAQAAAQANKILEKSLTPQVLKQHALDTLKQVAEHGNTVVVPQDFNGFINVGK